MLTFNVAFVEGYSYPALFMKSNSTAKMYVDFTFSMLNNKTWNLYPHFTGLDTPNPPANLTVVETPSSFTGNATDVKGIFTITATGNAKGIYSLILGYYCDAVPVVVGLNESKAILTIVYNVIGAPKGCGIPPEDSPNINFIGYSGVTANGITVDANNTITITSVSQNVTLPYPHNLVTPLKQLQMGIQAQNVICDWSGFELIIKSEDGSPACVSPHTAQGLIERGWGYFPLRLR